MDNRDNLTPVHDTIALGLGKLGMPDLCCHSTTFLIRDGYCVGRRFLFEGIQAVWLIAENVVRFYDESGRMLKSLEPGAPEREAVA